MVDGGDIYGDGVNVAARLEGMAEPGGICISAAVMNQVKNKMELRVENLGSHQVKNIAEPLLVYRVLMGATAARPWAQVWLANLRRQPRAIAALVLALLLASGVAAGGYLYPRVTPPASGMPAIAVLPFDNMSGDAELGYFSEGVTEDIITMLSRYPDIAVVARNSSFVYKGKAVDVRQVGKDLGVAFVLEGSVRKEADKVRIVAQLIDARTGQHVWAQRYDNAGSDPWVLQDEVIGKIVASLTGERGQLKRAEYKQAWGKDTADLEEYDYYLRGHELFLRLTKEGNARAGEIWGEGLAKFPNSSLLRVKLGWFHAHLALFYWTEDSAAEFRRAGELAREALAMENVSPQTQRMGHWLLAYVSMYGDRDFERALSETEAAEALAPYDAPLLADLSQVFVAIGKPDQALASLEEASRRDPGLTGDEWQWAWAYYVKGDYEKAIEAASRLEPPGVENYILPAASYVRLGRMEAARAAVAKMLEIDPGFSQAKVRTGYIYSDPSILERQLADLGKAGLPEK
jgi:TolB-like protein/tetratricopeptide (TPR) repeat protein